MKETENDKNLELIAKRLGGELNADEAKEMEQLLNNQDFKKEFENTEKIWEMSESDESDNFSADTGWESLKSRINIKQDHKYTKKLWLSLSRVAAILLLIISVAFGVQYFVNKVAVVKVTAHQNQSDRPVILPDGTKVYLNAGASLAYPKTFAKNKRIVELSGEAYFEVTHNKNYPFEIKTKYAKIKVLGTSFNVLAVPKTDSIQVAVTSGIVELTALLGNRKIQIAKGNAGVYYYSRDTLKYSDFDVNSNAWVTKKLIFTNSSLEYVTQTLEHIYGKKLTLETENIKNCRLTADFKDSNLEKILEAVKESLGLKIKKNKHGYLITGPGC
jgi:transmembrane sensor